MGLLTNRKELAAATAVEAWKSTFSSPYWMTAVHGDECVEECVVVSED